MYGIRISDREKDAKIEDVVDVVYCLKKRGKRESRRRRRRSVSPLPPSKDRRSCCDGLGPQFCTKSTLREGDLAVVLFLPRQHPCRKKLFAPHVLRRCSTADRRYQTAEVYSS